jgi:hypothetical protein
MRNQLKRAIRQFRDFPHIPELAQWREVRFDFQDAPHVRPDPLRDRQRAVYLFFREQQWLKIGQTVYPQRFTSQHYGTRRSGSCLAKDLWLNRHEFGYEGPEEGIGNWMFANIGRCNLVFPAGWPDEIPRMLEVFLHLKLAPRFEGRRQ